MAIETKALGEAGGIQINLAESTLAGRFTQKQLEMAFALVQNLDHWKGPVNALIPVWEMDVVAAAIEHFTGTEATFGAPSLDIVRVTAPGYWAGPCN